MTIVDLREGSGPVRQIGRCPLLAQSGHSLMRSPMSAYDPKRTSRKRRLGTSRAPVRPSL